MGRHSSLLRHELEELKDSFSTFDAHAAEKVCVCVCACARLCVSVCVHKNTDTHVSMCTCV